MPLVTTLMASAGDSVPLGDLSFDLPSSVLPSRSSRNTVTMRRISASAGTSAGNSSDRPIESTRICTMDTSSSSESGVGRITVLKRRLSALDISLTPRSLLLAVAIRLKPRAARTSCASSGMGSVFSDNIDINVSCTSAGTRVSSSSRPSAPLSMARIMGLGTSAARLGPLESSSA